MTTFSFFKISFLRNALAASLGFLIFIAIFAYLQLRGVDHFLVLYTSGAGSPNFLGTVGDVWSIIGAAFVAVLVNGFLIHILHPRSRFLAQLFALGTLFFSILIFIAVAGIIAVN